MGSCCPGLRLYAPLATPSEQREGASEAISIRWILSTGCPPPVLVPNEHTTCQWLHTGRGFPKPGGSGGSPGVGRVHTPLPGALHYSPSAAQDGTEIRQTPVGTLPSLSCHCPCGCPQTTPYAPTCPLLWPRQRVLQQGLENLRHVHGRGYFSPLITAPHGPAGGVCSGVWKQLERQGLAKEPQAGEAGGVEA